MMRSHRFTAIVVGLMAVGILLSSTSTHAADAKAKKDKPSVEKPKTEKPKTDKPKDAKPTSFLEKLIKPAKVKESAKKATPKSPKKKAAKPKRTVVRFLIKGSYPEGPEMAMTFGKKKQSLATIIKRMDQAGKDKNVVAVLLQIEGAALGRGKVDELRAAVGRLRKHGKPVYALLTTADANQYLLAAACDKIILAPPGMLMVPGVRLEMTFFKDMLGKLGLEVDMLKMGKCKGAAEPFTRSSMSPALRENLEAMVDDSYEQMVALIAKDRKLEDYQVKTLLDQGLFTAAAARKAGLVDRVAYADEVLDDLRKKHKKVELKVATDYKKKRSRAEFSGLTGMVKMMELMLGGRPTAHVTGKKQIAVVYAVGPIVQGKSSKKFFGGNVLGSSTIVKALRTAAENPNVRAIVLRVDSPGGSSVASDLIWREIVKIKKPVIASMGDIAASGGYYISMGADKIFAEPGTLTGSIGVVGGKLVTAKLYDKIGLNVEVISRGKNSGSFSSTRRYTPEERKVWMTTMKDVYRQFVGKAAKGRKMSYRKVDKLAQGRVYTGRMAVANGLIDRLGTLHDAIAEAKKAAGLKPGEKVDLLILPRPKTIFEQLFNDTDAMSRLGSPLDEIVGTLGRVELLRQLLAEGVLTMMPFQAEMK